MYRRNNAPVVQANTSQSSQKQLSKEQLTQWQSTFNLITYLLRSHNHNTLLTSFSHLKRHIALKKKYSNFLANKLHLLFRRKQRQHIKNGFSCLVSNRIHFYSAQREEYQQMREKLQNKGAALIFVIGNKLYNKKRKDYWDELRMKSAVRAKVGNFKVRHISNVLSQLLNKKIRQTWTRICIYGKHRLTALRKISRIQKLINTKHKQFSSWGLLKLRANAIKTVTAQKTNQTPPQEPSPKPTQGPAKTDRELQTELRRLQTEQRTLTDKKRTLQRQLSKVQSQSEQKLSQFRREIQRLESQNSQLVFNYQLLEQNNKQLQKEYESKQKGGRKKLPKAQIWENVYNNLLHFLAVNKDKPVTKAALLQCLQTPLVPCGLNVEELTDQNNVLSQLLQQYKKNFPPPASTEASSDVLLPFDVIRRQNKYYYQVLEVLSEWGLPGSKELEQLNTDLAAIQKKINGSP